MKRDLVLTLDNGIVRTSKGGEPGPQGPVGPQGPAGPFGPGAQINNFGTPTPIPGTNTSTPIVFTASVYSNPSSMVDLPNDRIVIPEPGIYLLSLWGFFSGGVPQIDQANGLLPALAIQVNGSDNAALAIQVNGSDNADLHADLLSGTVHTILMLNGGDLVTATASQGLDAGGDPTLNMNARLSVQRIG